MQKAGPVEDDKATTVLSGKGRSALSRPVSIMRIFSIASSPDIPFVQNDDEDDDIRSDLQEGAGSEVARTVPIHSNDIVSLRALIVYRSRLMASARARARSW